MSRNDRIMSQFERLESKNKRNSKIMNFRLGISRGQYLRAFPKHEGENLHTSIILEMNNPLQQSKNVDFIKSYKLVKTHIKQKKG